MKYLDKTGLTRLVEKLKALIPTKTSDLTNDSNYITDSDSRLTNSRTPTSHASSATTYGVGTTSSYGHCRTINNVTTSAHTNGYALSAYQGKLLADRIKALEDKLANVTTDANGIHISSAVYCNGNEVVCDDDYKDPSSSS